MVQQVTVTADTRVSLRPLLESAIHTQAKMLTLGLQRVRERLLVFEQRFSMSSDDFERRFNARELNESLDFIEWLGELKTLRLLEDQQQALRNLQLN